jgi:hypothetical protein
MRRSIYLLFLSKKSSLILAHKCGEVLERAYKYFINMTAGRQVQQICKEKAPAGQELLDQIYTSL